MYMIRIMTALCFLLSGALAGCTTSLLNIASPEIIVNVGETDDSLRAGTRSGLKAGTRSGLKAGTRSGLKR